MVTEYTKDVCTILLDNDYIKMISTMNHTNLRQLGLKYAKTFYDKLKHTIFRRSSASDAGKVHHLSRKNIL